jgi:hypothetical protein
MGAVGAAPGEIALQLRILGDHPPEQSLQDGPLVDERRIRNRKAVRVGELVRPLGTRRKVKSHVGRGP